MIKKIGEPIKRGMLRNKLFLWAVIIPFVLFTVYTLLIAKPRYVSNSSVTVQNINEHIVTGKQIGRAHV